jgi:ATP-dependent exoDNAse (exonuclease V) beta subunit
MNTIEELLEHENVRLDGEQMRAVKADGNVVVGAGAGSGKTTVLSYRFLRLMLSGIDCDKILALTFTQKAAREMEGRIGSLLSRLSSATDLDEETHRFLEVQLKDHFPLATISTLDSFCSNVLRSDCLRYGFPADFSIDVTKAGTMARSVARKMLWNVEGDEGARILSSLYPADTLLDILSRLAVEEYHLPDPIPEDFEERADGWCGKRIAEAKGQLLAFIREVSAFDVPDKLAPGLALKKAFADGWLPRIESDSWDGFADEFKPLNWTRLGSKVKPGSFAECIKVNYADFSCKDNLEVLCASVFFQAHHEDFLKVLSFLRRYAEACAVEKRRSGILCFNDVSHLAVDVLRTNVKLRKFYGGKFDAIMVDEFQDNNRLQRDLLFLLAAKDSFEVQEIPSAKDLKEKLFFVGDEKQSIYRFRGADVSVFKALSASFPSDPPIRMETNYRTDKYLIDLFSKMFRTIMADASAPYEAVFKELHASPAKEKAGFPSTMTILFKQKEKKQAAEASDAAATQDKKETEGKTEVSEEAEMAKRDECEAYAVALKIEEMLRGDHYLIPDKEGALHRPKASDIAILMQKGTHQMETEKALRHFGIPYTIAKTSRSLMLEAPANDFYALLQLCVYPGDRIAYLAFLRSPFCGLPDEVVASVAPKDGVPFDPALSGDERYQKSCAFFKDFKSSSEHLSLPSLLQKAWMESGYRFSLLSHPNCQVYLEHYNYLYHFAEIEQENGKSLASFLDDIRPYLATATKIDAFDEEILQEEKDGVHILTIHSSKGLEFPIVFVVGMTSGNREPSSFRPPYGIDGTSVPWFSEDNLSVLFDDHEKEQILAEAKRLLYVALTRAEHHLVLCGSRYDRMSADNLFDESLRALDLNPEKLEAGTTPDGVVLEEIPKVLSNALWSSRNFSSTDSKTIEEWYQAKPFDDAVYQDNRVAVTSLVPEKPHTKEAVPLPSLPVDDYLATHGLTADWGTFVHALVMREMGCLNQGVSDQKLLPDALSALPKEEVKPLIEQARLLSSNFLSSEFYKKEIAPYPVKGEVRFFSRVEASGEPVVAEGSIDILVTRPDGYDIIDFKTDSQREPEVHRGQVELYKSAVERFTGKKARCAILYLRESSKVEWWN